MSKSHESFQTVTRMNSQAAARIQSATAKDSGGKVSGDSFAASELRAAARNAGK